MRVAYFPYKPGGNPFQFLFAAALEQAGNEVIRVPPAKWFPLQKVVRHNFDLLQLDWPHDWYRGRNTATAIAKQLMYKDGLRRLRKRPLVWTAHNLIAHDALDVEFEKRMMQKLINVANGIIVMSELAGRQLTDLYDIPANTIVRVIPHGHYMDVYPNTSTRETARKKLGIARDRKVVLSLGRIMAYKGFEELIEAFGALATDNTTLVIAGSCASKEYADSLRAQAAQYSSARSNIVIHAKFIDDADLHYYFNAADFAALPFRNILNSGSLMLALSFGKCVVAPDLGSIREVVYPDGWINYSTAEDLGLARALVEALNRDDLIKLEMRIKKFVIEKYSWSTIGQNVNKLYQDIS